MRIEPHLLNQAVNDSIRNMSALGHDLDKVAHSNNRLTLKTIGYNCLYTFLDDRGTLAAIDLSQIEGYI